MRKYLIPAAILIVIAIAAFIYARSTKKDKVQYQFAKIDRGTIEAVISCTGTLNAIYTVQVGSQISGTIAKLYADFNSKVKKGQLIAQIDTRMLQASVSDAYSTLDKAKAQLAQTQNDYKRTQELFDKKFSSQSELDAAKNNYEAAKANLESAKANVDKAAINLKYAAIRAPISGTVIQRNVDVGQTVAASLSSPVLFIIANDLSKMQILANVDESDIGQVQIGQSARFTVQSFPNKTFYGKVNQIRLQPTTIQNVVNYTVVIDVSNESGELLPGMTATIDILLQSEQNAIRVTNAALRFRPPPDVMAKALNELPDSLKNRMKGRSSSQQNGSANTQVSPGGNTGGNQSAGANRQFGRLWYLDNKGNIKLLPVRIGITDGQYTEIRSKNVSEGMQVISGVATQAGNNSNSSLFGRRPAGR